MTTITDADVAENTDEFDQTSGPARIPIKAWRARREVGYENLAAALAARFDDVDADDLRPDVEEQT